MWDCNLYNTCKTSNSSSSSGRKDNGEGGIAFENEDEKEQWQEDQKVSGTVNIYV